MLKNSNLNLLILSNLYPAAENPLSLICQAMSSSANHSEKAPQTRKSPEKRKASPLCTPDTMSTQRVSDLPMGKRSALATTSAPIPVAIPAAAPAAIPAAAPAPAPVATPAAAPVQHNEALKNRIAALRKETQGASLRAARDNTTKALQCAANAKNAANNATHAAKLPQNRRAKLLMTPALLMEIAKSAHRAADMSAAAAHECTKIASGIATSTSQTEALNMLTRTAEQCYIARSTSDTAIALTNAVRSILMLNM